MSKKLIITICTLVVLCIVGVMAFVFTPKDAPIDNSSTPKSSNGQTTDSHIADPKKAVVEKEPTENPDDTAVTPIIDGKNVESLEGFTDDEIKESAQFVTDFAYASLTNRYFIGGHFSEDGWPTEKVKDFSTQFFSKKMTDELDVIETLKNENKGDEYRNNVFPHVFFLGDNGSNRPADECRIDVADQNAINDGKSIATSGDGCIISPLKFSDIDYYVVEIDGKDRMVYDFDVTFDVRVTDNETGKDLATTVEYEYRLTLADTVDPVTDEFTYEIDGSDTKFSISQTRELPEAEGSN